jgi:hypothetical protein
LEVAPLPKIEVNIPSESYVGTKFNIQLSGEEAKDVEGKVQVVVYGKEGEERTFNVNDLGGCVLGRWSAEGRGVGGNKRRGISRAPRRCWGREGEEIKFSNQSFRGKFEVNTGDYVGKLKVSVAIEGYPTSENSVFVVPAPKLAWYVN